jgi:hypothetical protein
VRWGDPMAGLVSKNSGHALTSDKTKKKSKANDGPQLEYTGRVHMPNRFNIKPGAAWDGVLLFFLLKFFFFCGFFVGRDRSNGFESRAFNYKNKAKQNADSFMAWEVNDL